MYPNTPEDLQCEHPAIYQNVYRQEGPLPSIVDGRLLLTICNAVPCRNTHHALSLTRAMSIATPMVRERACIAEAPENPGLPGLQIFRPGMAGSSQLPPGHSFGPSSSAPWLFSWGSILQFLQKYDGMYIYHNASVYIALPEGSLHSFLNPSGSGPLLPWFPQSPARFPQA